VIASFLVFKETHIPIILVAQPSNCDSILQNSFYDQILFKEESLHDIRRGGFTSVWLPPVCKSVQWQGYLPGGLYDIDSFYGSLTQLQRLVKLLKEHGLQVWIDWPVKRRCLREQVGIAAFSLSIHTCGYIEMYYDIGSKPSQSYVCDQTNMDCGLSPIFI